MDTVYHEDCALKDLDLTERMVTILAKHDLKTVDAVLALLKDGGKQALLSLNGVGKATVETLLLAIETAGYALPLMPNQDEQPRVPDDDNLADEVIFALEGQFRFFRGTWHEYKKGYWQEVKNINPKIIATLRANRRMGIRPSRARCVSVDFFVQAALELEDDACVDDYPNYINLKNGLFNLKSGKLEPHSRDTFMTAQASFAYDAKAEAPIFEDWLYKMLVKPDGKTPDSSLISLVQEAMGYSLTSDTSHRVSFWLFGPSGSGKSTFLNVLIDLMESYHSTIDLNQLGLNRFLLSRIAGKRLVTFGEADAQTRLADGIYKMLVSDDVILADVKNREPIEFTPQCKIWWAMNNLPYVADRSGAVDSRVIIIPFRRQLDRSEWDLQLDEKLHAERAGIFNFAYEGLRRLQQRNKFTVCAQVEALRDEYTRSQDVYASFLDDSEWVVKEGRTEPTPLYKAFVAWCNDAGIKHHASKVSISREWERLGLEKGHDGSKRFYKGVSLSIKAMNNL